MPQTKLTKKSEDTATDQIATTKKADLIGIPMIISGIKTIPSKNGVVNLYTATVPPNNRAVAFFGSGVMDRQNVEVGSAVVIDTGVSKKGQFYKFYSPE